MRVRSLSILFVAGLFVLKPPPAKAGAELIEVRVGDETHQGRTVAHNKSQFWLLDRTGRMHRFPIHSVKDFRKLSPTFRGLSAADMRADLRKEFGSEYEVAGTTHYLVVARKGSSAVYARVFEDAYRKFTSYVSRRGIRVERPGFPMVAIVFRTKKEFLDYSRQEGVNFGFNVLGYYHRRSNRVAMFDSLNGTVSRNESSTDWSESAFARLTKSNPTLLDTIIHEGTHQAAFNVGLHSRIGQTPRWIVEGIATVFEAPAIRNRTVSNNIKSRLNSERLTHFLEFADKRRGVRKLAQFVAEDAAFRRPLDAYSESWALTYFLVERKSWQFSKYLQILAKRDPLKPYTATERMQDFQSAFGKDFDRLEREYLRFILALK